MGKIKPTEGNQDEQTFFSKSRPKRTKSKPKRKRLKNPGVARVRSQGNLTQNMPTSSSALATRKRRRYEAKQDSNKLDQDVRVRRHSGRRELATKYHHAKTHAKSSRTKSESRHSTLGSRQTTTGSERTHTLTASRTQANTHTHAHRSLSHTHTQTERERERGERDVPWQAAARWAPPVCCPPQEA